MRLRVANVLAAVDRQDAGVRGSRESHQSPLEVPSMYIWNPRNEIASTGWECESYPMYGALTPSMEKYLTFPTFHTCISGLIWLDLSLGMVFEIEQRAIISIFTFYFHKILTIFVLNFDVCGVVQRKC